MLFLAVFLICLTILSGFVGKSILIVEEGRTQFNIIGKAINWVSNVGSSVPGLSLAMQLFKRVYTLLFVQSQYRMFFMAILGIPLLYILLRLIRQGG